MEQSPNGTSQINTWKEPPQGMVTSEISCLLCSQEQTNCIFIKPYQQHHHHHKFIHQQHPPTPVPLVRRSTSSAGAPHYSGGTQHAAASHPTAGLHGTAAHMVSLRPRQPSAVFPHRLFSLQSPAASPLAVLCAVHLVYLGVQAASQSTSTSPQARPVRSSHIHECSVLISAPRLKSHCSVAPRERLMNAAAEGAALLLLHLQALSLLRVCTLEYAGRHLYLDSAQVVPPC